MNLYRVYQVGRMTKQTFCPEFIIALDSNKAIEKYIEIKEGVSNIGCDRICKREEMIPTVEPLKEFNYLVSK